MFEHRIKPRLIDAYITNFQWGTVAGSTPRERWRNFLAQQTGKTGKQTYLEGEFLKLKGFTGTLSDMLNAWVGSTHGLRTEMTATNLIANSNMETNITGWNVYHSGALTQSTTQAFVGTNSLRVVTTGAQADGASANNVTGLTPNSSYTFSAWVFIPNGVTLTCELDTTTTADGFVQSVTTTLVGNGAWQRISKTVVLGATETKVQPFLYTTAATTFYVDAATFKLGK